MSSNVNNINQDISLSPQSSISEKESKQKIFSGKKSPQNNIIQPPILSSLIKNIERQNSLKTTDTKLPVLDYDFCEIKRFNELNHSLSDISEFDLEKDKDKNKSEFNSSESNNSDFEDEIIIVKSKKKVDLRNINYEYEKELEEEYEEILKDLKFGKK